MPDTTPIREHNFGEGPNRAKHSGYAQGGRETRTYHRESSIHRRKGPAPTPDYDDIDSPEAYIGYKRFIDPEGSGPIHDVSHDYTHHARTCRTTPGVPGNADGRPRD